jgi:hypothetical protein
MTKRLSLISIAGAMLAITGCDGDGGGDAGMVGVDACPTGMICLDDDAGQDAGMEPEVDAGPEVCSPAPITGSAAGAACQRGTECRDDDCNPELAVQFTTNTGGGYPITMYPDSMCGDVCDPASMTDQCGECATCTDFSYVGRVRLPALGLNAAMDQIILLPGVCRSNCTPDADTNGGCRDGYTCDIDAQVCIEACTSNADCNVGVADGFLAPDPTGPWTCNMTNGRCELMGTAGVAAGDACTEDTDCMDNGQCLTGDAIPGGFCTRLGCNSPDFACGTDETCSIRGLGGPSWCLPSCMVGNESADDALGVGGHGEGCPEGHACSWNGIGEEPVGGCFPAEYNDITVPNVGEACQDTADCYSPFGYGACLFATENTVDSGMCAIQNCVGMNAMGILPGVTTTTRVCDEAVGEVCVGFSGGDTYCLLGCDTAADCAPGYACAGLLSSGDSLCWPNCIAADDCRSGATCQAVDEETGAVSACDFDGPDNVANSGDEPSCFCSDRMPRMDADAGMPDTDAGMAAMMDAGMTP